MEIHPADIAIALIRVLPIARPLVEHVLPSVLKRSEWTALEALYLLEDQRYEGSIGREDFLDAFKAISVYVSEETLKEWRTNSFAERTPLPCLPPSRFWSLL